MNLYFDKWFFILISAFIFFQFYREIKTKIWVKTWKNLWNAFISFEIYVYFINNVRFLLLLVPLFIFSNKEEVDEFKFNYNLLAAFFYIVLGVIFIFSANC